MDLNYGVKTGRWGPYNKDYLGICHIADETTGATFNVELFTGFTKRTLLSQKVIGDNGVKMWSANKNLTRFAYRYEIEWKDRVYMDATFTVKNDKQVAIDCKFVNNTDLSQNCTVNLAAYITYPSKKWWYNFIDFKPIYDPVITKDTRYIHAANYTDIRCAQEFAIDGFRLAESVCDNASDKGTCINAEFFGKNEKDFLRYEFEEITADSVGVRYMAKNDASVVFEINGKEYPITLKACKEFNFVTTTIDKTKISSFTFRAGGDPIYVDSFIVGLNARAVSFAKRKYNTKSQKRSFDDGMILSFDGIKSSYFVGWDKPQKLIIKFDSDNLGEILSEHIHNSLFSEIESGKEQKCFYDVAVSDQIIIEPHGETTVRYFISSDGRRFDAADFENEIVEPYRVKCNEEGEKFRFSQNALSYNTLLNVIYPVYARGKYIAHTIPGRLWDSLYTWDNGFIGLGLSTIDFCRALDCLKTFLTPVGDIHAPFIMSGTLMPTQIMLYAELINGYGDREELKELYPSIKQYYSFYSGLKYEKRQTGSGLLKLWHLNYNSGGWDDYPPQKALTFSQFNSENYGALIKGNADISNTTPVIVTAVTVLIAKIMKEIAERFGFKEDIGFYKEDIEYFSSAIQKYAYDEESGYYQYVVHDKNGNPRGFLKHKDGTLYNYGFDGIYPYIAGICDRRQSDKILDNVKNGLFTDCGVSAVDLRATYYRDNGYWNGSVWFPHQWILWKALLDDGQTDISTEIALKALTVYGKETDATYCSFENFTIKTKRGNGYHQFSGLTCPCLNWFKAYFTPGSVSCGFLTQLYDIKTSGRGDFVEFSYTTETENACVLVCVNSEFEYNCFVDGKKVKTATAINGAFYINLIKKSGKITVKIAEERLK